MSYAIDRQDFTDNVLKDGSIPATGFVPSRLTNRPDGKDFRETSGTFTAYDMKKAQEYLDAGLQKFGVDNITIRLLYGTDESPMDTLAEYLQNAFSKLDGLTIEMVATTKQDRLYNKEANSDFDLALTRWGPDYADPTTYLNLMISDNNNNYGKYVNEAFDEAIEQAIAVGTDVEER